jgi:dnd system-associated protein 4
MIQRLCVDKIPDLDKSLFPTIREFLSFSALLGYSEGRKIPLDKKAGVEDIAGAQYEHHEAFEIVLALAIAASKSSDILKEGNEAECALIYEEYANGGMTLVAEWLAASPDQGPDRAIYTGLVQAGYITNDQEGNIESQIADISF